MLKNDKKIKGKVEILVGNLNISNKVSKIFDPNIVDFLDEISKEIFKKKKNLSFQDLACLLEKFSQHQHYLTSF